ncbi:hypothetical protein ACQKF0_16315 [Bacillus wiedmannii]|uniref:Phr family secreted Rap phosphatase inhibitor n=1 Tax=Bacillus toyonensis TaxID=155322 RepID=A0AB36SR91_9BACI|nr:MULTISPECIES: hypothetical protein [Bacillus cereus group]PEI32420.1 hypothetical protein CN644_24230 [Bacillus wiedmannii]PEM03440.1 hypothetical protein CN604_02760 [Bacillus wiedmannii]PEN57149.1 hypothetical protein CN596_04160 [Bacillus toyonensis]HDR6317719.1 hypothetical protein [Bacillus thuringiensis]
MKKIVASVVIACTLALSVLSIGSVPNKDNQAAEKVKEVQLMKMDPGTLG